MHLHHHHRHPQHHPTKPTLIRRTPFLKKRACDDSDGDEHEQQNPAGKRQRRQKAAAALVQHVPSWTGVGKNSKAQPRPAVHILPRGIGPVAEPNQNDVLCGRGGRINSHEGNVQCRDIVNDTKKDYLAKSTKKLEKAHIAAGVVQQIRTMDPSGRFLKKDSDTGMWWDIGDARAIKKVGQALREDASGFDDSNHNGDKKQEKSPGKKGDDKKTSSKGSPKTDKSVGSGSPKKHGIVLPTTCSSRRHEDSSPGALPPQSNLNQPQLALSNGQPGFDQYQQVLPPSGATHVPLPSTGPPQAQAGTPSAQSSNSSTTLRHGQFSLRGPDGATSAKAMETMNRQQMDMILFANNRDIFGRNFIPPLEMSLGSHGSSIVSGLSGFRNSQLMNESLLWGVSSLTATGASYRRHLAAVVAASWTLEAQQLANMNNAAMVLAMQQ